MTGATVTRAAAAAPADTSLRPGWNLASVPNQPPSTDPAAVFSSIAGHFNRVYAWDACAPGGEWKLYDPADAAASNLTVVDSKIGFWIEMTAPAPVPNPGTLADETTIHLCTGWNLIGFPAGQARPVRTALSSIEGRYARVFGFDPADMADPWEVYDVAVPAWANDLELMQPGRGYWVLATQDADLTISNTGPEPEVAITAPADLAVVTAPTAVTGTVKSDRLESWTLSSRAHGEADAVVLATGNTPVVNGSLGTLDPTLLLNGGYTVELEATDFNGQTSTAAIDVNVEGQMKIGNFSLQFLDLEIPLSGLPIQVYRNYDSRDKRRGDFGVGWTLELRQGSYRNNREPGDGWQFASGFLPCQNIGETKSHVTTIRLSDQEIYRFRLRLASPAPTLGGCFGQARFDFVDGPVPGATLAILGNTEVIYQNGSNYVIDSDSLELYEPQQVRLTTRDGRAFDFDLVQGATRLQDLNGNTLSITPAGVAHSSGLSVAFQRDTQGRIVSITDPEGASTTYSYDAAGDLVAVKDRESNTTRFVYAANHYLLEIQDPLGRKPVRNEYDESGRLVRTTDTAGKSIELDHQMEDRQEIITDRLGHTRLLEYDDRGNVVREVDANGNETRKTFDAKDHLLTETDPLGNIVINVFDANGNLISVTNPEGNRTSYTYNSRGQLLTVLDPRGKLIKSAYDAQGNLLSVTDPLGNNSSYTRDARGNLLSVTDAEGSQTRYRVDDKGRLVSETDALGTETTYTYDAAGKQRTRTTTRTTSQGTETLTWAYVYDRMGRLTQVTDPDGTTSETIYDARGNITESTDRKGRRTGYIYDLMGRLIRVNFPDGTAELSSYDAAGRRITRTDRGGRTTTFAYDSLSRLLTTTYPDGAVFANVYDAAGRLIESQDARRNSTHYEYDDAGRRTKVIDPLNHAMTFIYDARGNQLAAVDARANTVRFEYDDSNRPIRVIFPDGTTQQIAYDRVGRRMSVTDQAGRATHYSYDLLGRLTTVTDALNQITHFAYDEQGSRISQIDAKGHETRFEYDKIGRRTKTTLSDSMTETFAYDQVGNRIRRTDFNGATTTYSYDLNDRLLSRSYPDGSSVNFTYAPTGQRETVVDSRGTTTYAYDTGNRLTALTYPNGRQLLFTYDEQGNRTSVTAVLAGETLATQYSYDALNRLETVTDPAGKVYVHTYDANGNRASVSYPNGVVTGYGYDALNRLQSLSTAHTVAGVIQSYRYTLGPVGNRTRVEEHDGTVREYAYDPLYRLTQETANHSGVNAYQNDFTYDAVGNRLRQERSAAGATGTINYSYDDRDQLLTEDATDYVWDANGNRTSKSGADGGTYTWDFENRLIEVQLANGTVIEHAYDADGNRVRTEVTPATGPPKITEYLVNPLHILSSIASAPALSQVVAETDSTGSLVNYYVRGDDLLAALRPDVLPGTFVARYYHADGMGSIRALTDDHGAVTDRYDFEAFGKLIGHQGQDLNAYLFAGEANDPNSGFYYLRARWLDPASGSFVSVDPFMGNAFEPTTLHRYLYAGANPVNAVDPAGMDFNLSSALAALSVASFLTNITFAVINLIRSFFAPTPEEADRLRFAAAMNTLGAFLAYFGGGFGGPSLAASGVGSLGSAVIMRADLIIGSVAIPTASIVLMSASGPGSGSGGSGGSGSGEGGDDISVKDDHVNLPKHNLDRLAPTWAQQRQMLIDAVRKLANVAPKGSNPAGSFFEATVEIESTTGQKILTTIRWFGYRDGSNVINTAFVP